MTIKRMIFLIVGCVSLALGCTGIVLPILPTVPFFLLTVFCFANSSQKLHDWFIGTRMYKKHLESFVQKKGMTIRAKVTILSSVTLLMGRRLCTDVTQGTVDSLHNSRRDLDLPSDLFSSRRQNPPC